MGTPRTAGRPAADRTPSARPPRGARVTREDVARLAGVSTAVVSYVLNDGPRPVAEQTAERVREAVRLLDYRPNSSARALRRGSSDILGLVVADGLNPFFGEYTAALVSAAGAVGQRLLIADSCGDPDTEKASIEDLVTRQIDGLFLAGHLMSLPSTAWGDADSVPLVLIDSPGPIPGRLTVGASAEKGARELVSHLAVAHQYRRIGIIVGEAGFGDPDPRMRGWEQALGSARLPLGPVARAPFTREGGHRAGQELLDTDPRPDAVFATSDQLAIGLLRAIHERGLTVPGDVAVVSYDGTRESEYTWPPLTVARQPLAAMAAAAVELMRSPDGASTRHVQIDTDLVLRASCGCAPLPPSHSERNP